VTITINCLVFEEKAIVCVCFDRQAYYVCELSTIGIDLFDLTELLSRPKFKVNLEGWISNPPWIVHPTHFCLEIRYARLCHVTYRCGTLLPTHIPAVTCNFVFPVLVTWLYFLSGIRPSRTSVMLLVSYNENSAEACRFCIVAELMLLISN